MTTENCGSEFSKFFSHTLVWEVSQSRFQGIDNQKNLRILENEDADRPLTGIDLCMPELFRFVLHIEE